MTLASRRCVQLQLEIEDTGRADVESAIVLVYMRAREGGGGGGEGLLGREGGWYIFNF